MLFIGYRLCHCEEANGRRGNLDEIASLISFARNDGSLGFPDFLTHYHPTAESFVY